MDISDWRERIDQVDRRILEQLNERANLVLHLVPLKRQQALPVHEPKREAEVVARVTSLNEGPLENSAVEHIFQTIMEEMRAFQEKKLSGGEAPSVPASPSSKTRA